ncbi:MAG: ATP-binding protein [Candidatus Omnitrophica bacterium]|nr:ATP-binding protein [Candidatus Omnitrophota bacterium]
MKFRPRTLEKVILKAIKSFPAIVITGPRQSGKTTLFKMLFSKTHNFVSLEDPDIRIRAREDPRAFFAQYKPPLIIDEVQYVPELLSYIKTKIDQNRKAGQWLFTGSQNFVLMNKISQSLSGRIAVLSLLPFSVSERINKGKNTQDILDWVRKIDIESKSEEKISLSEILLRGFFPEISARKKVDRKIWFSSYITTYLERDIRNLLNIGDLNQFERFLISCAVRTAQILNLSEIARDVGISMPTAKRWLSLLETAQVVYLLYPYYRNIGKRIIKSPKIYFTDTGLCSYLLGFDDAKVLFKTPSFSNLFETMIVCDFWKRFLHFGRRPSMYYLRSRDGLEVDLVIELEGKLHLFEIKSAMTITPKHAISLKKTSSTLNAKIETLAIISCSEDNFVVKEKIKNYSWKNILVY